MKIRLYRHSDAPGLAAIYQRAVQEIGAHDYTVDQVRVWAAASPDTARMAAMAGDGRTVWVAETAEGCPCGFIDLEPNGHIDLMFISPDHSRSGVGVALYKALEKTARSQGHAKLTVEASEAARRFFQRQGFREIQRNTKQLQGVAIHNYSMEKQL